ncbi:MAG: hypothetical protein QOF21_3005, partial [Actinomycetota bacterium]
MPTVWCTRSIGRVEAAVPQRLGYEPRLDGLRAIAVTLVIISHSFDSGAGPIGVGVFFVLSGFLITAIIDDERTRTGGVNLRYFYARRALRLYPALVAFVSVYVVGLVFHIWKTSIGKGLGGAAMALTYTTDIFTLVGKGRWLAFETQLTWSLAVEEQFYLLWPLAFLLLMRFVPTWRQRWIVLGSGIVVAAAVRAITSRYAAVALSPLTWTDALLIGCCLALAYRNGWIKPRRMHPLVLVVAALPAVRISAYGLRPGFDQIIGL